MPADWEQHCPIDEKDHPILRQAWGGAGCTACYTAPANQTASERRTCSVARRCYRCGCKASPLRTSTSVQVDHSSTPMFDEEHFPYEYDCEDCSTSATVTHEDVQHVPAFFAAKPVAEAVEYVMDRRNWSVQSFEGPFCPDCAEGKD